MGISGSLISVFGNEKLQLLSMVLTGKETRNLDGGIWEFGSLNICPRGSPLLLIPILWGQQWPWWASSQWLPLPVRSGEQAQDLFLFVQRSLGSSSCNLGGGSQPLVQEDPWWFSLTLCLSLFLILRDNVAVPGLEPRSPSGTEANLLPHPNVTCLHLNHSCVSYCEILLQHLSFEAPASKLHVSCCPG